MLTVGEADIYVDRDIKSVAFAANGEYIVGGDDKGVGVWRRSGQKLATLAATYVQIVAVSRDGRWIAAGTFNGSAIVWDAKTYERVLTVDGTGHSSTINGVDFSPDSARLVTASKSCTATVYDVTTRQTVLTLDHDKEVTAAKYSPQGDRIATTTNHGPVRVWDSNDGRLLVHIPVSVVSWGNTCLLWSNNHLFVASSTDIKQFEASTGSTVSEWKAADTYSNDDSWIALPQHAQFIAHSHKDTFWDPSTHTRLGAIKHTHTQRIRSIALSPDDRFLVIGGHSRNVVINDVSDVSPAFYPTVSIRR